MAGKKILIFGKIKKYNKKAIYNQYFIIIKRHQQQQITSHIVSRVPPTIIFIIIIIIKYNTSYFIQKYPLRHLNCVRTYITYSYRQTLDIILIALELPKSEHISYIIPRAQTAQRHILRILIHTYTPYTFIYV